jgi:hypothetical protein
MKEPVKTAFVPNHGNLHCLKLGLLLCLAFIGFSCFSQDETRVSDPRLEVVGNTIHISYDILNASPGEQYIISIDVRDENGKKLNAESLQGDIGKINEAGEQKVIIWDPGADKIFIDSEIFIKVNCQIVLPEPPAVTKAEEPSGETQPPVSKEYTLTGLMLRSIVLPGLGLNKISGNPHWLKGVAGYACLGGSLVMNRVALGTYDGIQDLVEFEDKDALYQKALTQNRVSHALAYTAAAIWASDLVWVMVEGSKQRNLSMRGNLDPLTKTPLLSFRYIF